MKIRLESISLGLAATCVIGIIIFKYYPYQEADIGAVPPFALGGWLNVSNSRGDFIKISTSKIEGVDLEIKKVTLASKDPYTLRIFGIDDQSKEVVSYVLIEKGKNLIYLIENVPRTEDHEAREYAMGYYVRL